MITAPMEPLRLNGLGATAMQFVGVYGGSVYKGW